MAKRCNDKAAFSRKAPNILREKPRFVGGKAVFMMATGRKGQVIINTKF